MVAGYKPLTLGEEGKCLPLLVRLTALEGVGLGQFSEARALLFYMKR